MNIVSNFFLLLKKVMSFFTDGGTTNKSTKVNKIEPKVDNSVQKNSVQTKRPKEHFTNSDNGKTVVPNPKSQITATDTGKSVHYTPKAPILDARQPHTIQAIPFLKTNITIDYSKVYIVNYSISNSEGEQYPIIRVPKQGCEIKLPVKGRSGKRGVCEQKLCDTIERLGLNDFYDSFSLFVGDNTVAYEPDLVYMDISKSIFVDIEIDEPYSGWERRPIHYKLNGGRTIDDKRNDYFTERGWTVIRFTEMQVYKYPMECLKYIYLHLSSINPNIIIPSCLKNVADLQKEDMWTEQEAKRKEERKEREKLLGISNFIMPKEQVERTTIKDYPEGRRVEASIRGRKSQIVSNKITPFIYAHAKISEQIKEESDGNRQKEALQYELPHQVTTKSSPKTTPSSRGYA